jgi:multidrug efflux pump
MQKEKIKREFWLSSFSVNNRTSAIILALIISVMGVVSYISMPKESFPEVVLPTILVSSIYPGNSPVDMENLITRPIEKEIKSLSGIKDVKSTSIQDFSTIVVSFNPDVDIPKALQDVKDAVDRAKSDLPTDMDQDPTVRDVNLSNVPVMFINISGDYDIADLKDYAEYLQDQIEALSEVSSADIRGLLDREIRISADIYRMESMRVNFSDIESAIQGENVTISGGNILADDFRRTISVRGEFNRVEEIADVIVKADDGHIVYLRDVAEIKDTYEERSSYARSSQLPVVILDVVKRSGENLLIASDKIRAIVEKAKRDRLPADLNITITNDQSTATRMQVSNLENSIISGVILVVLVLLFFLGLRNALFVGIAIPLSMFMTFMLLSFMGVTINMMVLFSLILALGMLVDNGIVVVENIYRLMQQGYPPLRAAKEGAGEVAVPIIASTATTLAAFAPLAFWQGIIGEFMKYLPITLIITLASSLFVALVVNPVLASMLMKVNDPSRSTGRAKRKRTIVATVFIVLAVIMYAVAYFMPAVDYTLANLFMFFGLFLLAYVYFLTPAAAWFQGSFLTRIENVYEQLLTFALRGRNPYWFFAGTFLLLIGSVMLLAVSQPKVLFFPDNEPAYINVFIEEPIGTDIERTNARTQRIEQDIVEVLAPYQNVVEAIITQIGEGASDQMAGGPDIGITPHKARVTVSFVEFQERGGVSTTRLMEMVREKVDRYPGVQVSVAKNPQGPPVGKAINLEVSGEDYDKLVALATGLQQHLSDANIPGIEELKTDLETGKPELLVNIDRERARRFGLSTGQVAMELRTALFGKEVSKYKDGENEYPIQLRLHDNYRNSIESLMNAKITFRDKFGAMHQIPIMSVADVEYTSTYGSVRRKDMDRVISIFSNVKAGYNANEIVERISTMIRDYEMPEGYEVRITGEQEEQNKSMAFLMRALFIAVAVIFLIIVAQFNSLAAPFIIIASVLFSTIGVFLGLVIFKMEFVVIMTGIGIISLAGVVVNNAIVLLDYTNYLRSLKREELDLPEDRRLPYREVVNSIVASGKTRLRPVLLTAITTVLGLIPLATGLNIDFFGLLARFEPQIYYGGDNAIFWGPMAWTVIFGLTFATFLTLVIVPVMYLITDKIAHRISRAQLETV